MRQRARAPSPSFHDDGGEGDLGCALRQVQVPGTSQSRIFTKCTLLLFLREYVGAKGSTCVVASVLCGGGVRACANALSPAPVLSRCFPVGSVWFTPWQEDEGSEDEHRRAYMATALFSSFLHR